MQYSVYFIRPQTTEIAQERLRQENNGRLEVMPIVHGSHLTGKTGEHFPVREKSRNVAKTERVMEFYPEYWKIRKKFTGNLKKILEKSGKLVSQ